MPGLEGHRFHRGHTDLQALRLSRAPVKLQLGVKPDQRAGGGSESEVGRKAALEDSDKIIEGARRARTGFLYHRLGGGTGTAQLRSSRRCRARWER